MTTDRYNRLLSLLISACRDYRYFSNSNYYLDCLDSFILNLSFALFGDTFLSVEEAVEYLLVNYDVNYD